MLSQLWKAQPSNSFKFITKPNTAVKAPHSETRTLHYGIAGVDDISGMNEIVIGIAVLAVTALKLWQEGLQHSAGNLQKYKSENCQSTLRHLQLSGNRLEVHIIWSLST